MKKALLLLAILIAWAMQVPDTCSAEPFSSDEEFLNKLQYDSLHYFVGEVNKKNGLIKDSSRPGSPCSVAAVGFGLVAICIGESRGWIDREQAYGRVLMTLKTFRDKVPNKHGFFYHFLDMRTGQRTWDSEVSSIDTALLVAGALFCGEYYKGTEIEEVARHIYERIDWPWMLNGTSLLCMGWKPEEEFLPYYWDSYNEAMILYALAIGSPTHPIPSGAWDEWERPIGAYKGYMLVYCYTGSLFTYQYSHAWIDFRNIKDSINYYINSVKASQANRQFCIDNSTDYKTYGENSWGLTACIGPEGYKGYGAKPGGALHDGTIAPCGMAGSIPFIGSEAINGLKDIYEKHNNFLYGKYGFKDAYNLDKNWWAEEYLGIDVGITLLMIENYRTGLVWDKFMKIDAIKSWISKCMKKEDGLI